MIPSCNKKKVLAACIFLTQLAKLEDIRIIGLNFILRKRYYIYLHTYKCVLIFLKV
jgi:hypothetical protein